MKLIHLILLSTISGSKHSRCVIGDPCNYYIKSIGLTLDDILRDELRSNLPLNKQSLSIKLAVTVTIIMFVGGLINSVLSFITLQNNDCQQVGCGIYLLTASITSLLAVSMFTVKFWFVVLTQIDLSASISVLQGGCVFIEPILKLFLYFDGWLNACVAIERAVHVFKGVKFDKKKSKRFAQQIIVILPFCISGTLLHEPLYRDLIQYQPDTKKIGETDKYLNTTHQGATDRYALCVTHYSLSVQEYNTAILFLHLLVPFIANLCSALFIIFGVARQRAVARTKRPFREHVQEQFSEHKQLLISPMVLLILSTPRLIISLLPGCVKTSDNLWLYFTAYFISFVPSMLIFVIFVVPSDLYMKAFKQSFSRGRQRTRT